MFSRHHVQSLMSSRRSIRRWGWPLCLFVLGMGFALVPLAQGKLFFYWDNAKQHYAQTKFLHESLLQGRLPQWWPAAGMGFPVTAEGQAAHYSPVRLLLALIFPPSAAMMWEIGIYLALAGLGTYLFLRQLALSHQASVLGGICQMLGSFSVVFVRNLALHRAMCLFPFALWCAERFVKRRRVGDLLGAACVLGLQFLTGHPTFAVVTAVASTVYLCVRELQRSWRRERSLPAASRRLIQRAAAWAIAVALGFGIAGVQTIPTLVHVKESLRQGGLTFEYAVARGLPATPRGLGMMFLPYAYTQGDWVAERAAPGQDVNTVPSSGVYAGSLPIVLVAFAVLWSRRVSEPAIALALCWGTAAAFALGARTPLFPALWSLPGLNGLRYPHRFLLWSLFCLSALAAVGFDRLRLYARLRARRGGASLPSLPLAGIPLLCLAGCAAAWWLFPPLRDGLHISIVLFAGSFALIAALILGPARWRPLVGALIGLFVVCDLLYFRTRSGYAETVSASEALAPPPAVKFLQSQPGEFRVMSLVPLEGGWARNEELRELVQPDLCTIWGLDSLDFYATLVLKRHFAVREGIVAELRDRPESAAKLTGFLGALNVGYLVSRKNVNLPGWERVFETPMSIVWKNPSILPRYFLTGHTIVENDAVRREWQERARQRLQGYSEMVRDWSSRSGDAQVLDHILEEPVDQRTSAIVSPGVARAPDGLDPDATVHRLPGTSDSMAFEVRSSKSAFLYIAESDYPGWRAWVNGSESTIVRANWLGMGVSLPSGTSLVELRYVTPGYYLGVLVTSIAIGIVALSGFAVVGGR
jgi:hypothetical protein